MKKFKWPELDIKKLQSIVESSDSAEYGESFLLVSGYRVGKTGLEISERQAALERLFNASKSQFPEIQTGVGEACSCKRLRRIAYAIASLVWRLQKVNAKDYSIAIAHWREDLAYIKRAHYDGKCSQDGWDWPKLLS